MCLTFLFFITASLGSLSVGCDLAYHYIDIPKTCSDAHQYCREHYTDLATSNDHNNVCPKEEGCGDAWVRRCNGEDINGFRWLNPGDGNPGEPHLCAYVKKKPDGPLSWMKTTCDEEGKRFACYDSSKNRFTDGGSSESWIESVEQCKSEGTYLVSGCDLIEHRDFLKVLDGEEAGTGWWIGYYKDEIRIQPSRDGEGMGDSFDSPCCYSLSNNRRSRNDKRHFICYDDHMILVKENKTWEEALIHCRRNYGEMAMMTDKYQRRKVQERAKMADTDFVWVGLHFSCFFEEWLWVSGQWIASNDKNWEKRNEQHGCDLSGAMPKSGTDKWAKRPSEDQYNFVCTLHCRANKP